MELHNQHNQCGDPHCVEPTPIDARKIIDAEIARKAVDNMLNAIKGKKLEKELRKGQVIMRDLHGFYRKGHVTEFSVRANDHPRIEAVIVDEKMHQTLMGAIKGE